MDNCIKFACVGEWGSGNENQYLVGNLLNKMIKNNDIEFICGLGDNFYPDGLTTDNLKQEVINLQTKSQEFGETLRQKYGDGNINIETGEFTKID